MKLNASHRGQKAKSKFLDWQKVEDHIHGMRVGQQFRSRLILIALGIIVAVGWWLGRPNPVREIARLSDPDGLAELGKRGVNPRLNQIIYWLHVAETKGENPTNVVIGALRKNSTAEPRATLVQASLLRNLKIAHGLGLLTNAYDNLENLAGGRAARITRGPYAGEKTEVDHIVPISLAPDADNELSNLEIMPAALNRTKSNRIGERQLAHARKLHQAGLLSTEGLNAVTEQAKRHKYQEPERTAAESNP